MKSIKMRSLLFVLAIALMFIACKSKTDTNKDIVGIDSSAYYRNNVMADTAKVEALAPGTTKRVVETRNPDGSSTTVTTISRNKTSSPARTGTVRTSSVANSGGTATTTTTTKKGWSSRAKGAVIGGVGGAVVGAAVSKKKGKGALIGGAVGAAGGYIIGNEKDKKNGR
jgi:hypothetical protein